MPQLFRLKSDRNEEITHTNYVIPRRVQGTFFYYDMNL